MRVPLGSCFCFEFVTNETHEREKEGEIFEFKPAQTSGCGNGKTATEKYPMLFAVAAEPLPASLLCQRTVGQNNIFAD